MPWSSRTIGDRINRTIANMGGCSACVGAGATTSNGRRREQAHDQRHVLQELAHANPSQQVLFGSNTIDFATSPTTRLIYLVQRHPEQAEVLGVTAAASASSALAGAFALLADHHAEGPRRRRLHRPRNTSGLGGRVERVVGGVAKSWDLATCRWARCGGSPVGCTMPRDVVTPVPLVPGSQVTTIVSAIGRIGSRISGRRSPA